MRKTKLLLFVALLLGVGVAKAVETIDRVVISDLTVEPGSSTAYSFTVSLDGSETLYTAYQLDLQLPEGLEFAYSSNGKLRVSMVKPGIYPYTTEEEENEEGEMVEVKTYTHTLSCNVIESNVLRVAVISTSNEVFTAASGSLFKVYVNAGPYLKPGDVEIAVKNSIFTENQKQDDGTFIPVTHEAADYVSSSVKAAATSTLTLKVSGDNKFGTCILPFDYALPADGSLEAYTCDSHTDDVLLLSNVEKMEAYTPYILYSETGYEQTISGAVDAAEYPAEGTVKNGYLVGTVIPKELAAGSYVMQNQGDGTRFYRVGDVPFALSVGRCYVEMPEGTNAPLFRIGGAATTIQNMEIKNHKSEIINLLGQRVDRMIPGRIYVVNGRKVIAK